MKSNIALSLFVSAVACAVPGVAQEKPAAAGEVKKIIVHGRSLEGNLEGDSPDREVAVYLPPGYSKASRKRYPVVYVLHGYGRTAYDWYPVIGLPGSMDRNIAAGNSREMIIVVPDANTLYGGSMYSTSPTI